MADPVAKRHAYAAEVTRSAGVRDPRIEAAFAAVPREDFAGFPPWRVGSGAFGSDWVSDPERLYEDVLVGIDCRRGINNGQPSLHAQALDALGPKEGETIVQIGAGAGYYTAILATLVGPEGRVIAYEIEPDIAERAAANLARYPQVEVRARSGVEDLPAADAIYVNAAATHPLRAWLDALKPGGRLVFPLQAAGSSGAMLIVTRPERGEAWPARLADGGRVHRLRGRARSRDGSQARPGVPPRRPGEGALAALRRRAERGRLGPGRRLGSVDRAGRVGRSHGERESRRPCAAARSRIPSRRQIHPSQSPSAAFARRMPKKPIAGMRCERRSRHLRSVTSTASIKNDSPTSAMRRVDGSNRAAAPASSRPAVKKRQPLGSPSVGSWLPCRRH